MHFTRRLLATLVIPALILAVFAVSSVAAGGSNAKASVCHWANHKYVQISVSQNAVAAHMRHGDVMADEYGACP